MIDFPHHSESSQNFQPATGQRYELETHLRGIMTCGRNGNKRWELRVPLRALVNVTLYKFGSHLARNGPLTEASVR